MKLETACLSRTADLEALAPEWSALFERAQDATPFQSPEWLLPWWRHFGSGELFCVALRCDGVLTGLAPLFRYHADGQRRLAPLGAGISDYCDPLLEPACAEPCANAILRAVADANEWDAAEWPGLRADSPLLGAAVPPSCGASVAAEDAVVVRILPGTSAEFDAGLRGHLRRNLRKARARLEEKGTVRFVTADRTTEQELLERFYVLHGKRWSLRREPGVLADPRLRSFHREAAAGLMERGRLRLHALTIDGTAVAVLYAFTAHGTTCAYLGGFDPDLAEASPGTLLTAHAIEAAIGEGARRYDFLRGTEPHKFAWGAGTRPMFRLRLRRIEGAVRARYRHFRAEAGAGAPGRSDEGTSA